jgi:hypothetical protein
MSTNAIIGFAFALTAVLASPAFAQAKSRTGSHGYDRQVRAYVHQLARPHSVHPRWDIYNDSGRYRGTDPDPFIRSQLGRCREC